MTQKHKLGRKTWRQTVVLIPSKFRFIILRPPPSLLSNSASKMSEAAGHNPLIDYVFHVKGTHGWWLRIDKLIPRFMTWPWFKKLKRGERKYFIRVVVTSIILSELWESRQWSAELFMNHLTHGVSATSINGNNSGHGIRTKTREGELILEMYLSNNWGSQLCRENYPCNHYLEAVHAPLALP